MTPRIAIVSNPHSRRNRVDPTLARDLAAICGDRARLFETQDHEAIAEAARTCRDEGIEVLALNGGDGTNHHTLTTFVREYGDTPLPAIYLLRAGTMNTVADSLEVSKRGPRALMRRLVKHVDGELELGSEHRVLLMAEGQAGFLFGNGLGSRFLDVYYEGGNASPLKALRLVIQLCLSGLVLGRFARELFRPVRGRLIIDGEEVSLGPTASILMGTVQEIGFGFKPFWMARRDPGSIAMVAMPLNPLHTLLRLPLIYLGRAIRHPSFCIRTGREFWIENPENEGFFVDGDFHRHEGPIRIAAGPRLRIVIG